MKIFNKISDYNDKNSLGNKFRNKRFNFFYKKLKKLNQDKINILDIGGSEEFWELRGLAGNDKIRITLINLYSKKTNYSNIKWIKGNACDLSEFKKNEFDVIFSNSVIEHLYTFENQTLMANEVRRTGKYYFIQTPNKYFFIEPHFFLPGFQFLPRKLKIFILTKTKFSRGKKINFKTAEKKINEIRLLSVKEMKKLFPDSFLYKEKFMYFTKSITVYNF